jgi:uncharacterized RDD family membrane protein YckC
MIKQVALILRRSAAYLLDILLLFIVLAPFAYLIESVSGLRPQTSGQVWIAAILSFSIPVWLYFTLSDASQTGATLGKRIMGVRVTALADTQTITYSRALSRTALKLLPWELAHVFGFALADRVDDVVQSLGLVAANLLVVLYAAAMVIHAGRRSIHDLLVGTQVTSVHHADTRS